MSEEKLYNTPCDCGWSCPFPLRRCLKDPITSDYRDTWQTIHDNTAKCTHAVKFKREEGLLDDLYPMCFACAICAFLEGVSTKALYSWDFKTNDWILIDAK